MIQIEKSVLNNEKKNKEIINKQNNLLQAGLTKGPLPSLEEHVRPDWWCRIFNSLYLKTDADVVEDEQITEKEVNLFAQTIGLKKEDRALDLCCGQGRHTLGLNKKGFLNVEGLDRSHYLINRAKIKSKKDLLSIVFKEGDARKLPYQTDTFDAVFILGNSFGYFETINDDLRVLKEVMRVLKPWGKILIDVTNGEYLHNNFKPRSWEWIDKNYFVCRERELSADKERLISREIIIHSDKGVICDQFYAERLYSENKLKEVLDEAGFLNIQLHGEINTDSKRNQDLGMMEKRIIATAVVRKEWTKISRKSKIETLKVVVAMGDPTKNDIIKPNAVFDDDDIYTIDRLKGALKKLNSYEFIYLNNHDNMISQLSKLKGKADLVFNLCDEGYNNEPRMEAHVPALLEMLNIPYTGSGVQTLVYCYDKSLTRGIAREMDIPVPNAFFINPNETTYELPFDFPVIIKPNFGDSSFGITQRSVANNVEELSNAILEIREKFGYEKPVLVEEFLQGKDITFGIIGNISDSYIVLPVVEEDYSNLPKGLPKICGYEAKWMPDSPYWKNLRSVPANLPDKTSRMLEDWCLKLFDRLECKDYCRIDWRLDNEGTPKLLEVNPNPGWCWDGHLAKMSAFTEISYSNMLDKIISSAIDRYKIKNR